MWKGRYDVFRIKHCEAYGHHGKIIYRLPMDFYAKEQARDHFYFLKGKGSDANYFTE